MTTKEKLQELHAYYSLNKQVGHTSLMKAGTKNMENKFILVATKKDHAFLDEPSKNIVSWNSLDNLRGHDKPLAIDNGAMHKLLVDTINLIEDLEYDLAKANRKLGIQNRRDSFHA